MKIKNGYNNQETEIRIGARENGSVELWIKESGRPDNEIKETLSYMTIQELYELFREIKLEGQDLFN